MDNAQLINQTSGKVEYYTPQGIIEAARKTMGSIDLDPASSVIANKRVKAQSFFTKEDDGLSHAWFGNVWMNHPYGRGLNHLWISKLMGEYCASNIAQACCITYACTSEKWFRPLLQFPQCFLYGRTNYILPDGSVKEGNTKGSVVTYLGNNIEQFIVSFQSLGKVKI